jgi:hypothetical protein
VINRAVGSCDVLLAVIGDQWLTITDEQGRRRLDDPADFVRLEIQAALKRDVRIIPILVGGAHMPDADELPDDLTGLVRRQALELSPNRFEYDTLDSSKYSTRPSQTCGRHATSRRRYPSRLRGKPRKTLPRMMFPRPSEAIRVCSPTRTRLQCQLLSTPKKPHQPKVRLRKVMRADYRTTSAPLVGAERSVA